MKNKDVYLQAYKEVMDEIRTQGLKMNSKNLMPVPQNPSIDEMLYEIGPLPNDGLLLGAVSYDSLPLLLNLYDPFPQSLLMVGEQGSGKTDFLKFIAKVLEKRQKPSTVQYGVVTNFPDEWGFAQNSEHCVGVFPIYHDESADFLHASAGWAHSHRERRNKQSLLILVDDLNSASNDYDYEERITLDYLISKGAHRGVWTIATLNPKFLSEEARALNYLVSKFKTPLFSQMNSQPGVFGVTDTELNQIRNLIPKSEFAIREDYRLINFWIGS